MNNVSRAPSRRTTCPQRSILASECFHVPLNDVFIFPSNFVTQSANSAELPPWLQPQYSQRLWYDHALLLVIWWGNTLENLQTFHSSSAASGLVGNHTAYRLVEDTGRGAEMEGTW